MSGLGLKENLSLDIHLLRLARQAEAQGQPGLYWRPGLWLTESAPPAKSDKLWRQLVTSLKNQGLLTRTVKKPQPGTAFAGQKSVTVYRITNEGRKILEELGI